MVGDGRDEGVSRGGQKGRARRAQAGQSGGVGRRPFRSGLWKRRRYLASVWPAVCLWRPLSREHVPDVGKLETGSSSRQRDERILADSVRGTCSRRLCAAELAPFLLSFSLDFLDHLFHPE